jgi:hypothetical protein
MWLIPITWQPSIELTPISLVFKLGWVQLNIFILVIFPNKHLCFGKIEKYIKKQRKVGIQERKKEGILEKLEKSNHMIDI